MTIPRYGMGESLLQIKERAQPEAETSERVQSSHDPEPCEEREKGQWRGANDQEGQPGPSG